MAIALALGTIFLIPFLFNYAVAWIMYYWGHWWEHDTQIPPEYPSFFPYLGSAIPFILDNQNFLKRATSISGKLTSARICFLGSDIYLFQDRETVARIWKQPLLGSPIEVYSYTLKNFFGMHDRALSSYRQDNSGPFTKPFPGTNVPSESRVDHITHKGFLRALSGPGLMPTTHRFMQGLERRFDDLHLSTEWTQYPSIVEFFQDIVGGSLLQAIFGPTLLHLNPTFIQDLWQFDNNVPRLARGMPAFILPKPYRTRQRLRDQLKNWYAYAREHFDESLVQTDGDGDPIWGSELMRYRQRTVLQVPNHDDESLASADLGLAWGSVGNTIPCAMMAIIHIFKDQSLLARVRLGLRDGYGEISGADVEPKRLTQDPLLSSIYAETLRLYVQCYFVVSSPLLDVSLGKWWFPKGNIGLVNSGISHMDKSFWNTKRGAYPVQSFWADRFLRDSSDPTSGPMNPDLENDASSSRNVGGGESSFSLDSLEGSWIPFGGGHAICPGRFLAKHAIIFYMRPNNESVRR
ncbi:cytochrome P450 [Mollisia scopiformis]|uniref:Cytochrome P450 n=1 Tax=Mollisia scopiformis TaxID=149040 RepID=A0A194XGK6_MOLSC|nr:cytochrome P450 [Mollisia scopiformis]KUJ19330.1 cytochrome P450 [Mollisia scopiformis]